MKEVFVIFFITLVLIAMTTFVAFDVIDQQECDKKKGVYISHKCMKKEFFME